jgi:putative thioredoxin
MSTPSYILTATRSNFSELVLENSRKGLVMVDFWSPRAGPSLRQGEVLSRLARDMEGRFLLITVNTDEQSGLAREYGVHSLPSCRLFRHVRVVDEIRGMQPEADYRKLVERHLGGGAGAVQRQAIECWQHGDTDRAIRILAEGAMAAPDDPQIPLLLAKLLMQAGRHADAHAVLNALPDWLRDHPEIAHLGAHLDLIVTAAALSDSAELEARLPLRPDDWDSRYALAAVRLVKDDYEDALGELMRLHREVPDYRGGIPRRALLALFQMLDPSDERVRRFRAELFNLSH